MSFALSPITQVVVPQSSWESASTVPSAFPAIFESRTRSQKLEQIRKAHRATVERERVGAIPLPRGFTVHAVVLRLDQINSGRSAALHDRINEKELDILEARRDKKQKGVARFERALRALVEKSELLGQQRNNSYLTTFVCELQGDLPALVAATVTRSFYWESIGRAVLAQDLCPQAMAEAKSAGTPRLLGGVERTFWDRWGRVSQFLDRVLTERERLTLLLDCWNSSAPSEVYSLKAWRTAPLPPSWKTQLNQLRQATEMLQDVIIAEVPAPRIIEGFRLPDEMAQLARDLFQAEMEADAA